MMVFQKLYGSESGLLVLIDNMIAYFVPSLKVRDLGGERTGVEIRDANNV